MKLIKLYLERNTGTKRQRIAFLASGFVFFVNLIEPALLITKENTTFVFIYYVLNGLGLAVNLSAGLFLKKIKSARTGLLIDRSIFFVNGILLILDSIQKFLNRISPLPFFVLATGILNIVVGINLVALKKRRLITLGENEIIYRKSILITHKLPLEEIKNIIVENGRILIESKNSKKIALKLGSNEAAAVHSFKIQAENLFKKNN